LNRRNRLAAKSLVVTREFIFPKFLDERVSDLPDHPCPVFVVGQYPVHAQQGSILAIEQRGDGVV